jgi:ATP-dependent Lon protease
VSDKLTIPVLPLRDVVLFPGVTTPIGAGRPMTIKAIEAALASPDKLVLAIAQRENTETVTAEGLHRVGTIAPPRRPTGHGVPGQGGARPPGGRRADPR